MSQLTPLISRSYFGSYEGKEVGLFTLSNKNGVEVKVSNYGGVVVGVSVPDRDGVLGDIVLGFDDLAGYLADDFYLGAMTGRHANRISGGKFRLDGEDFQVTVNNGQNHLHGGESGFNSKVWDVVEESSGDLAVLRLRYVSPDGEEGFPGELTVHVTYSLTAEDELKIDYEAVTSRATVCNLSDHIYWNLSGEMKDNVLEHELQLFCDELTPMNESSVPTGEVREVAGGVFDFREPRRVGDGIDGDDEQIVLGAGYDHNFVIRGGAGKLRAVGRVHDGESGRVLEVFTTDYGVQFYTGNFLDESIVGKGGRRYGRRRGFCLECQMFPDSVNRPEFTSAVLRPGERYEKTTVYKFSVQ